MLWLNRCRSWAGKLLICRSIRCLTRIPCVMILMLLRNWFCMFQLLVCLPLQCTTILCSLCGTACDRCNSPSTLLLGHLTCLQHNNIVTVSGKHPQALL